MPAPYKKASSHGCLFLAICLFGIAASAVSGVYLGANKITLQELVIFFAPMLVCIGSAFAIVNWLNKSRIRRIKELLVSHGFNVRTKLTPQEKIEFYAPFTQLEGWFITRNGGQGVEWFAVHDDFTVIFEHEYVVGSGRSATAYPTTLVMWRGQRTEDLQLSLYKTRFGEKRLFERSLEEILIGDDPFDKEWSIKGLVESAGAILTDGFRAQLQDSPRGECWHFREGWIVCAFRNKLDAQNLERMMLRAKQMAISGV
jgi:hypothetical protein